MSAAAAALRLDVMTVRPYTRQLLMVLGAMGVLVVIGPPAVGLMAGAVFAAVVAAYPFAVEDKNDLGTLHASLPVQRGTLVLARYVLSLLTYLVATAAATVLAVAWSTTGDAVVTAGELGLVATAGFVTYALLVGIQLPVYYAVGYTRGRLLGYVPIMLLSAGGAALGASGEVDLGGLVEPLERQPGLVAGLAVLGGATVLVLSALASWRLDRRRTARVSAGARQAG
ncbi:ABC-2 transporter permease [Cellulomonas iranensis]|uniref:ABC-2 transporter permease n=1 Tax=Cellulomonas iranensis TaxID=76862 RepID=UPI0013CFD3CE|nr:ABC-2 transporter permease [Cellulomonas iranensis]